MIMGRVLHNWDLPTKQMLLQKAYCALPESGAIIVYERLRRRPPGQCKRTAEQPEHAS
jgi:hypothetical protein